LNLSNNLYYDFNINIKYSRLGFFSNSLFLKNKPSLLFKTLDNKEGLFLLPYNNKISKLNFNFLNFNSLNSSIKINFMNKINFDYFMKQTSIFLKIDDFIFKCFYDNLYKKKSLVKSFFSQNYNIFDNVFINYFINDKKRYFYLYKNNFLFDVYFK
jgi:hypothetical protein